MEIIKTFPGEDEFSLIDDLKKDLYTPKVLSKIVDDYNQDFLKEVYVLIENSNPLATVALYKNEQMNYGGYDCGTLGNYESINNQEISKMLLDHAILQAKVHGINFLIGPMNGSTWDDYRFCDEGNQTNFLFEPHNPKYYENHFTTVGFHPISEYVTNIDKNMNYDSETIQMREKYLEEIGVTIRPINMNEYENELKKIFQFSLTVFKKNFLFTPISWNEFRKKFFNMKNVTDPDHVLLAEYKDQIVGYVFNIKDNLNKNLNSLIIKKLAVNQNLQFRGLGQILVKKSAEIAKQKNYKAVVHALMNTKNQVVNLSTKN
jgi:predicted GNAT family acetyltransferase